MERRTFLRTLVGGVAVAAAARTWPFRVYSFPSAPKTVDPWAHWEGDGMPLGSTSAFREGDMIVICNPSQADAWAKVAYRVTKIDTRRRELTIENIRQSRLNWQGLSRSPQPFRV